MDARQQNRLSMHLAVREILDTPAYQSLWQANAGFVALEARWRDQVRLLESSALAQGVSLKGVRASKQRATDLLLDSTVEVAGALVAYALLAGDDTLKGKASLTRAGLAALRDQEIDDRAQMIHDLAAPLASAPAPAAGSTTPHFPNFLSNAANRLESLQSRITAYGLLVVSPTTARGRRKSVTDSIPAAEARAEELLADGLDRLMTQWKDSAPDFYRDYTNARQIIDRPGGRGSGSNNNGGGTPPPPTAPSNT